MPLSSDWPEQIELEPTAMAQGGDAVGRWEGRAVFASGVLPGEHARIRLYDRQKAFARGRATDVLRTAAERVTSFCPLEQSCGAADWRWIEPEAQRRFKVEILREQLQHIGGLVVPVNEPEPINNSQDMVAYRTTAELHVHDDRIGYFLPGTRRTGDVPACCLHHPLINDALAALRPLLNPHLGLRGITLRCSPHADTVLGLLETRPNARRGALHSLTRRWREAFPMLVGVVHGENNQVLDGAAFLERRVGNVVFHVSAGSFFQINYRQVERMAKRVRELIDPRPNTRLLDLYCGVGLFTLSLASSVAEVVGIEEWAPAIEDARRSAQLNNVSNASFEAGSVETMLDAQSKLFNYVVLDPPRRGCAPEVMSGLAKLRPERIVYVSCHPGTLARDCKLLAEAGYRVTSAEVIDMFPHTHHVESIVHLKRGG